ncbi:MAG: DUF4178 domain-containing protein [Gammaproteobacteria bacterium]
MAEFRSINCTQCGGALTLNGGHRIESITCGYCGSVLDAKQDYRTVKKFMMERRQPPSPLSIGMKGRLNDVPFTIIGLVEYTSCTDLSSWFEFFLFSPTHGYAWLEYDGGHYVFSHKVRDLPDRPVTAVEKSSFVVRHQRFKVYESYRAKITYVEGELTWTARVGDEIALIDAIAPPSIYTVEKTANEQEYSYGEYMTCDAVYRAFKIKEKPAKPREVHPAQPFEAGGFWQGLAHAGKVFLPVNLVLLIIVLIAGGGEEVLNMQLSAASYLAGAGTRSFTISQPDRLVSLDLNQPLQDAWAWYDIEVLHDDQTLYSMSQAISYYSGYEDGEHWSEGSTHAHAYFKVPEAGDYQLYLVGEGGTGEYGKTPQDRTLSLTVTEGVLVSRYFLSMALLSLLALLATPLYRWHFETKRWGGYEDDDD